MRKLTGILAAVAVMIIGSCTGNGGKTDYADGVRSMADLGGRKVSIISGSLHDLLLTDMTPRPQLLRLASHAEVIAALESGQADYIVQDSIFAIGADMEGRGFKCVFVSDEVAGPYGFGFRHEDRLVQTQLNEYMDCCRADGRMAEMVNRWIKGDVAAVQMPEIPMPDDGPVIRVGTTSSFPFSFIQNGRNAGLEIEILERFAAETGHRIEFQIIDFSGLIAALASNKIDLICAAMTITEERSRQVLFSDPYYYCRTTCYCRDENAALNKKPFLTDQKDKFYNNLILEDRWKLVVKGLWETLVISIMSILLGTILGGFICWMKLSRRKLLQKIATVYVDIIRGVPILVLLMLMFYVVFATGSISARWVAIIAFAMNFGGYVSEMFRTGIQSVDRGQTEAGLAMGFSSLGTFVTFVIPQAAKKVLPVFKGEAISLIKNTSVVGFIAIQDLTKSSEIIRARTFDAFFPLLIISALYFLLAWLFGKLLDMINSKIA